MGTDTEEDQERGELKISSLIMLILSATILVLRFVDIVIFQPEFEVLIIYMPTFIIGVAWIRMYRGSRSQVGTA